MCPTWHVRWLKRNLISWSPSSVSCHRTRSRWKPSRLDWQHLDGAENDLATTATHVSHLIYCEKSQYYFFVATVSFKALGQQVHFSSHSFSEDVQYNPSEKTHVVITMQQSLVFIWKLCYAKHLNFYNEFLKIFGTSITAVKHSNFDAAHVDLIMDILSYVVSINGTTQVNSHPQWCKHSRTPSCCKKNPEMNTLLRCRNVLSVVNEESHWLLMPCDKNTPKRGRDWLIFNEGL